MKTILKWFLVALGLVVAVYVSIILGGIFAFVGATLLIRTNVAKRVEQDIELHV